MRIGKKPRSNRFYRRAGEKVKPKNVIAEGVIGQMSPDIVGDHLRHLVIAQATSRLEQYADDLVNFSDASNEAEINMDGTANTVLPPKEPVFHTQYKVDEFNRIIDDVSHHFTNHKLWKVHVSAARFERSLDEKYGMFRPFITNHPEIEQFIRNIQRRYAMGEMSPFRKPPIPRSTSIVILFMMQRGGMSWQFMTLAVLFFLVGLQPWALMGLLFVAQLYKSRRLNRRVGKMPRKVNLPPPYYQVDDEDEPSEKEQARKRDLLLEPVGTERADLKEPLNADDYDVILVGVGSAALYAAALLSRVGRKVLVLCPNRDISEVENVHGVPVDLENLNMTRISKQQSFLAPALCTDNDCQGGIRFAKVGSENDGHAFQILSIPGVGTEKNTDQLPFIIKADGGKHALMNDMATYLGDGWPSDDGGVGESASGAFLTALEGLNSTAGEYYLSKILSESVVKYLRTTKYQNAAVQSAETLLNQFFPLNTHVRALLAGLGMPGENLRPKKASMAAHVTNLCGALCGEGMHYPIGGGRALCRALAHVVEHSGGRIVTKVGIKELVFEESGATSSGKDEETPKPSCVGIKFDDSTTLCFSTDRFADSKTPAPVVISMISFMDTFLRMFPADVRNKYGCPVGLPALKEQRPVIKFAFVAKGDSRELDLTGADYYRLPGAARPLDEMAPDTGVVTHGEIGWEDEDETNAAAAAPGVSGADRKRRKHVQKKFEPGISWIHVSFPSAKDPSFASRHPGLSTCVVTIEADDDLVQDMGTTPRLFQTKNSTSMNDNLRKLQKSVEKDLYEIYPQLNSKLVAGKIVGPRHRGLSHTPERYAAKGVRVDTPYKNFLYGGHDLTVGESFSASLVAAWLVANKVMDYSWIDYLFFQKNITTDIARFTDSPGMDEDDLAVPFSQPEPQEAASSQ